MNEKERYRLVSELTQLDAREATRKGHNPYALAHYLRAVDDVVEAVEAGATLTRAFSQAFLPTRGMHRVARNLGLSLDVERGEWITKQEGDGA